MAALFIALSLFALASADICAEPMEGGVGDPAFCRVEPDTRIETPYFSIDTDPAFLVGLDSGGRRIRMQGSIRQEQASLQVDIIDATELAEEQHRFRDCAEFQMNGAAGQFCDRSGNGQVWREYLFRQSDTSVVVNIHASELGAMSLPRLEQIFQSLEFHEVQP